MASESKKFLLFKTLIAVGFALSIILLVQTISTYKYVAGELMMQEAERDTQRKVNTLVGAVRTAQTQNMELIGEILREFLEDWNQQVAWVRIVDGMGMSLAAAGPAPTEPVPADKLPRGFSSERQVPQQQESPLGPVLVSIRSFRTVPLGPAPHRNGRTRILRTAQFRRHAASDTGPIGFGGRARVRRERNSDSRRAWTTTFFGSELECRNCDHSGERFRFLCQPAAVT